MALLFFDLMYGPTDDEVEVDDLPEEDDDE